MSQRPHNSLRRRPVHRHRGGPPRVSSAGGGSLPTNPETLLTIGQTTGIAASSDLTQLERIRRDRDQHPSP